MAAALAEVIVSTGYGTYRACIPAEVEIRQFGLIVTKYLNDHPEEFQFAAGGIVAKALAQAFPCSEK